MTAVTAQNAKFERIGSVEKWNYNFWPKCGGDYVITALDPILQPPHSAAVLQKTRYDNLASVKIDGRFEAPYGVVDFRVEN